MWYWIVMFLLAAGCVLMLSVSFASIKKNKASDAAVNAGGRTRRQKEEPGAGDTGRYAVNRGRREPAKRQISQKKRRQWKIFLEDIDSWEKYSFTFYDTVGIGRGRDEGRYERYLAITDDGRVSKTHCVIIHRGDKLYLKDEDSRNGTFLNGERIGQPVVIQRDDIIGIGETRLEIQRILRESDS